MEETLSVCYRSLSLDKKEYRDTGTDNPRARTRVDHLLFARDALKGIVSAVIVTQVTAVVIHNASLRSTPSGAQTPIRSLAARRIVIGYVVEQVGGCRHDRWRLPATLLS
jgi:hypothetical protein